MNCNRKSRLPVSYGIMTMLAAMAGAYAGAADAQAVEHNAPMPPESSAVLVAPPNLAPADQSAAPVAGPLKAIVLLGATEAVRGEVEPGVKLTGSVRLRDVAVLRKRLDRDLG